jgi:hypothetical protein
MTEVQFAAGAMVEVFLFATTSRPALGPTQPPIRQKHKVDNVAEVITTSRII